MPGSSRRSRELEELAESLWAQWAVREITMPGWKSLQSHLAHVSSAHSARGAGSAGLFGKHRKDRKVSRCTRRLTASRSRGQGVRRSRSTSPSCRLSRRCLRECVKCEYTPLKKLAGNGGTWDKTKNFVKATSKH